jgi:hypothetical protein
MGERLCRRPILAVGAAAAAVFIGFVKTAALDGLFERFVLIETQKLAKPGNILENEKPRSLARAM